MQLVHLHGRTFSAYVSEDYLPYLCDLQIYKKLERYTDINNNLYVLCLLNIYTAERFDTIIKL